MTIKVQVTFDCEDPHRMARFWAGTLGYEKENHVDFVAELLAAGRIPESATMKVDGGIQFADVARVVTPRVPVRGFSFKRFRKARP
jgi:hypothetical protein